MLLARIAPISAALFLLPGCLYDGWYVVRGTVYEEGPAGEREPLPGVTVVTKDGPSGPAQKAVESGADGAYRAVYWYGGMLLPFVHHGSGDPYVSFTATGRQPAQIRLLPNGYDRHAPTPSCGVPEPMPCFTVDAVLVPTAP